MTTARRLAPVLAASLACGPSLARLERGHHYDEALCGVSERAFAERDVLAALHRGLDPAVHAAVVPHDDLVAAAGAELPELRERVLVRVVFSTNEVPLRGFSARFGLQGGAPAQDVDLRLLAELLREPLPGPRTVGPDRIGQTIDAIGTIGGFVLQVATLGIFSGFFGGGGSSSSSTEEPTVEELRRAAPRAAAVIDAVGHLQGTCHGAGAQCSALLLVDAAAATAADLALVVALRYDGCTYIAEDLAVALPAGPDLRARLDARFGARMHRLAELPTRPAAPLPLQRSAIPSPTLPQFPIQRGR